MPLARLGNLWDDKTSLNSGEVDCADPVKAIYGKYHSARVRLFVIILKAGYFGRAPMLLHWDVLVCAPVSTHWYLVFWRRMSWNEKSANTQCWKGVIVRRGFGNLHGIIVRYVWSKQFERVFCDCLHANYGFADVFIGCLADSSILCNALLACHPGRCKSVENNFVKLPFISQPRVIYTLFCMGL